MKIVRWNGKSVRMPGIIAGMTLNFYHSAEAAIEPSISSSGLRKIIKDSPKHYFANSPYNPNRTDDEETETLILGRATHHLLFGQENFRKEFVIRPVTVNGEAWHSNKIICKAWLRQAEGEGLTVITQAQLDSITGMAEALAKEPLVKAGILNGQIEHSWFWKDKGTGVWCKSRPDASPNDSLDFADLKITRSTAWIDMQRSIRDYAYHQQGALIGEACQELLHQQMNSFSLVFIEHKYPHDIAVVTIKDDDLARGHKMNVIARRQFADCLKSGHWPGRAGDKQDARYIDLPDYDRTRIDERIKLELGEKQ